MNPLCYFSDPQIAANLFFQIGAYPEDFFATMLAKEMRALHPNYQPDTFLDLGCGPGNSTISFQENFGFKKIFAIDGLSNMLDFFNQHVREHLGAKGSTESILLDLEKERLPIKDNSIDVVNATAILGYLKDPYHLYEEVARVLKKDGKFSLTIEMTDGFDSKAFLGEVGVFSFSHSSERFWNFFYRKAFKAIYTKTDKLCNGLETNLLIFQKMVA